jgi:N-acetylmuramic acid 6-phosphate etherase
LPKSPSAPITEQRNPASTAIDALETSAILEAIQQQDASVPSAVQVEIPKIALAVVAVVKALGQGGRLFYVGAGTSGRLGVLDAAECPPTFGVSRETVQAVLAGGTRALTRAAEAAEDDAAQGRRDLARRRIGPRDVVIGLTASGCTPYTIGALRYAQSRRAATVAVTANPASPVTRLARIAIAPQTGPEVLAGSTRMKAALAQKMVLHMISTAAMIRLGRVYQNYMVGVRPTNRKLVARACSIIVSVTGASRASAARALRAAGFDVRVAIVMLRTGCDRAAASRLLARYGGSLRELLESRARL